MGYHILDMKNIFTLIPESIYITVIVDYAYSKYGVFFQTCSDSRKKLHNI